jgi:glycosyltransferase involved in cell wall biosynthesis
MHVLIISSGYPNVYEPLDGIFYKDQAEALFKMGNKVGVVSTIPVSVFSLFKRRKWCFGLGSHDMNGLQTYTYTYLNRPKSPKYAIKMARKYGERMFEKYINANGVPNILHLHCYEAGELARTIKEKWGIPYVVTEHSSRFLLNTVPNSLKRYASSAFSEAAQRISVSPYLKEVLESIYNIDFQFIPNIVDVDSFYISASYPKHSCFTFVHVAGLNSNKNQTILLEAFKRINEKQKETRLVVVGDGPMRVRLQALAVKLGISNSVNFLGFRSREELCKIYNESHVFVLSSIRETFGVVLIEAMSCGLPLVSTKSGGPESIITNAELGELTEIGSKELCEGMKRVLDRYTTFDATRIRKYALENYSGSSVANKLVDIYKKVLLNE